MPETQRLPVPRNDGGEMDTALAFLSFARECVLKKVAGLDEAELRRQLVVTDTTLLGLVQHLAVGERFWFEHHVAGFGSDTDWDFTMQVSPDISVAQVVGNYRDAIAASDAVIAEIADPTVLTALPVDGEHRTLRWVIAHVTSETVRHAGHADILREQIDGATGR